MIGGGEGEGEGGGERRLIDLRGFAAGKNEQMHLMQKCTLVYLTNKRNIGSV